MGQIWPATCFIKYSFIEPQPYPSLTHFLWPLLSYSDSQGVVTDMLWFTKLNIFIIRTFTESLLTHDSIHTTFHSIPSNTILAEIRGLNHFPSLKLAMFLPYQVITAQNNMTFHTGDLPLSRNSTEETTQGPPGKSCGRTVGQ